VVGGGPRGHSCSDQTDPPEREYQAESPGFPCHPTTDLEWMSILAVSYLRCFLPCLSPCPSRIRQFPPSVCDAQFDKADSNNGPPLSPSPACLAWLPAVTCPSCQDHDGEPQIRFHTPTHKPLVSNHNRALGQTCIDTTHLSVSARTDPRQRSTTHCQSIVPNSRPSRGAISATGKPGDVKLSTRGRDAGITAYPRVR
jgi:hypothetical protein